MVNFLLYFCYTRLFLKDRKVKTKHNQLVFGIEILERSNGEYLPERIILIEKIEEDIKKCKKACQEEFPKAYDYLERYKK